MKGKHDTIGELEVWADAMLGGMSASDAIIAQEKRGQDVLGRGHLLPQELRVSGEKRSPVELYAAMGIQVLGEADDLFFNAKLPNGWKVEATEHQMHSYVVDAQGRNRIHIFYKAAFYDRVAHASVERRYWFKQLYDNGYLPFTVILDGIKEIDRIGITVTKEHDEYAANQANGEAYLNKHYPDWRNPFAYWD